MTLTVQADGEEDALPPCALSLTQLCEEGDQITRLAATGAPVRLIYALCAHERAEGRRETLAQFTRRCKAQLQRGAALADLRVHSALHDLASSGKSAQATLAWAKHRLGWKEESAKDEQDIAARSASPAHIQNQNSFALLQAFVDELAAHKTSDVAPSAAMAADGSVQSVTPNSSA